MISGIVTKVHPSYYTVQAQDQEFHCHLRGKIKEVERDVVRPVAVGDRVKFTIGESERGAIDEIQERKNKISRRLPHQQTKEQILAANIDCVVAVQSVRRPKIRHICLDQCLSAGERFQIPEAMVCINKTDLLNQSWTDWKQNHLPDYERIGYNLYRTSATGNRGIQKLRRKLHGKSSFFVGPSGVGKTSLINTLSGDQTLNRETGEVGRHDLGTHTTSVTEMVRMDEDSYLFDSPGLEKLPMWQTKPKELEAFFPEIYEHGRNCRFSDCRHRSEPGCRVKEAVEAGEIHPKRLDSYRNIVGELEHRLEEAPWE